ncbi:MAG: N-acetylglucosamine-6-phosphate deacetylase, partial [Pseudonocardiales bacterium]|nr:N-acetylglucosamine-6-phosphate deacetylase [Pseudonocardiales bacterium]
DAVVEVVDGRIVAVRTGPVPDGAADLGGGWLLPGFVDLHVHGGGGHDVTSSRAAMEAAARFHLSHGTTRMLVSLMAAPVDRLCEQLSWVASLVDAGVVLGAHLEGPFLAAARCGAQNQAHLLEPDPLVLAKLLDAADGNLRQMTVAPELPGALELIADLTEAGIVAAIGHTGATYEQATAGFGAGARLATHLFNGMSPVSHREPGAAVAALDAGVVVEMINDGVHVHDAITRLVGRSQDGRVALVTDAVSAAGAGDGTYTLGDREIVVHDGAVRLAESGRLAGSTLTMDEAVRRYVVEVGLPVEAAAAAAATTPARLLGIADRCGAIVAGADADLVHLDDNFRLQRVMTRGTWVS